MQKCRTNNYYDKCVKERGENISRGETLAGEKHVKHAYINVTPVNENRDGKNREKEGVKEERALAGSCNIVLSSSKRRQIAVRWPSVYPPGYPPINRLTQELRED